MSIIQATAKHPVLIYHRYSIFWLQQDDLTQPKHETAEASRIAGPTVSYEVKHLREGPSRGEGLLMITDLKVGMPWRSNHKPEVELQVEIYYSSQYKLLRRDTGTQKTSF